MSTVARPRTGWSEIRSLRSHPLHFSSLSTVPAEQLAHDDRPGHSLGASASVRYLVGCFWLEVSGRDRLQ
jgi:hypothetical protein